MDKEKDFQLHYGDIKKIAELSGLTRQTVSRFFRTGKVNLTTAKKILEAYEKINNDETSSN